jgi:hypothetical protein
LFSYLHNFILLDTDVIALGYGIRLETQKNILLENYFYDSNVLVEKINITFDFTILFYSLHNLTYYIMKQIPVESIVFNLNMRERLVFKGNVRLR